MSYYGRADAAIGKNALMERGKLSTCFVSDVFDVDPVVTELEGEVTLNSVIKAAGVISPGFNLLKLCE